MNINCRRSLSLELFQTLCRLTRAWFRTVGLHRFIGIFLFSLIAIQAHASDLTSPCRYGNSSIDNVVLFTRNAASVASITDEVLLNSLTNLSSSLTGTPIPYISLFSSLMVGEKVGCALSIGDYRSAAQMASTWSVELAVMRPLCDFFFGVCSAAKLIEISLDYFYDSAVNLAINNQTKLYRAARNMGYSSAEIMGKVTKSGDILTYTDDGWLYIVDSQSIPSYGAIRPGTYTREQVYGGIEQSYQAESSFAANYMKEKQQIADEFSKLVNPAITYSPIQPSAPSEVNFEASGALVNASNAVSFVWDFGDGGQTGTQKSEQHFYRQSGSYNVKLTMTDADGPHEVTQSVTIRQHAIYLDYPNGTDHFKVKLSTNSSSYIKSYSWNFGDGSPAESGDSLTSVSHDYPPSSACYTVRLTMTLKDDSTIQSEEYFCVGPGRRTIQGHTVYGSETWYTGGTYVVQGTVTVAPGATLTIQPGVRVEMGGGAQFFVTGNLIATGVTFTWDGTNQWGGIRFQGTGASGSRLANCLIENASGAYAWSNEAPDTAVIYVADASPTISGCTIRNSTAQSGIYLNRASSPTIENSTISGFTTGLGAGIAVGANTFFSDNASNPTVKGNTLTGNHYGIFIANSGGSSNSGTYQNNVISSNSEYGIYYSSGDTWYSLGSNTDPIIAGNSFANNGKRDVFWQGGINSAITWADARDYAASNLIIRQSGSLVVSQGKLVEVTYGSEIQVFGTLTATGTRFTWDGTNEWRGIRFSGSEANRSQLTDCLIEHAGGTNAWSNESPNTAAIYINGGSPIISGCTIRNSSADSGIWLNRASSPIIENSTISGFTTGLGAGIAVGANTFFSDNASNPTVKGNTLTGNHYGIFIANSGGSSNSGTYQNNVISSNSEYGIYNSGPITVTATNNDWGDRFGPRDTSDDRATGGLYNPNGLGNKVSDHVNYYPWTNSTVGTAAVPTGFAGAPGSYAANLKWNANLEPDLGGYKIYYGTTSGVYGAPKMVGNVNADMLTGLSNGTPYFIAIASLNTVGTESAKSAEIVITPIYDATKPTDGTLTATPGTQQITLNWSVAMDAGTGLSIVTPYRLVKADGTTAPGDCAGSPIYLGNALTFADVGLAAGRAYAYRLCAYDNSGNVSVGATVTAATPTLGSENLTPKVEQGWNLLGNSLNQAFSVVPTFADMAVVTTVWKWDTGTTGWQFYTPLMDAPTLQTYAVSKGYGVLSVINPGEGYWVNAKASATLPSQTGTAFALTSANLITGWNLVATGNDVTPSAFNTSLSATPPSPGVIPINLTTLWAWDNPLSQWYFYAPSLEASGGLAAYITGKGYLDFTQHAKTLGKGVGFWVNRP